MTGFPRDGYYRLYSEMAAQLQRMTVIRAAGRVSDQIED